MKDVKSIINARVAMGATVVKNAVITSIYLCEEQDNGRIPVIVRLDKAVPSMVQVDQNYLDRLGSSIESLEQSIKTETDDEKKAALQSQLDEMKAFEASINLDDFVEGESDTIFSSNFELLAILRNDPKTAFAIRMVQQLPELLENIFSFSKANILCEKVNAGDEYSAPFSSTISVIPNSSIYHTLYNVAIGDEGKDFVKELRKRHMDRLMSKLDKADKKSNDDEDDDD